MPNDQIRNLENRLHIAGMLVELGELKTGTNAKGVEWASFEGKLQCGPTPAYNVNFRWFSNATKKDNTDSKLYENGIRWYKKAKSAASNPSDPTMVDMTGSLSANDYVRVTGELEEGFRYNVQFFNKFENYAYDLDLEAYITGVRDVLDKDGAPTGRKWLRLTTMDFYGNVLDIRNIIVKEDLAEQLEDQGYERGRTAYMCLTWAPENGTESNRKSSGFGTIREAKPRTKMALYLTGGKTAYDEDSKKSITKDQAAAMKSARDEHLTEIQNAGYKGQAKNNNAKASTKPQRFSQVEEDDDDELPF